MKNLRPLTALSLCIAFASATPSTQAAPKGLMATLATTICLLTSAHQTGGNKPFSCVKAFGGSSDDHGMSIIPASNGGYFTTGFTTSYGPGDSNLFLMKYDASLALEWAQLVGGNTSEYGYSVAMTTQNNTIIVGSTSSFGAGGSDILIVQFSRFGDFKWAKTLGGSKDDWGNSTAATSDGGFVLAGYTTSYGSGEEAVLLAKFDAAGDLEWVRTLAGRNNNQAHGVTVTKDGGVVVCSIIIDAAHNNNNMTVSKFSSAGDFMWSRTLGKSDSNSETRCVRPTDDGGFVLSGASGGYIADIYAVLLTKFDVNGLPEWVKAIGKDSFNYGETVTVSPDGNYYVAGTTTTGSSWDMIFLQVNRTGDLQWLATLGDSGREDIFGIVLRSNGVLVGIGGTTSYGMGGADILLAALSPSNLTACATLAVPTVKEVATTEWVSFSPEVTAPNVTLRRIDPVVEAFMPNATTVCQSSLSPTPSPTASPTPSPSVDEGPQPNDEIPSDSVAAGDQYAFKVITSKYFTQPLGYPMTLSAAQTGPKPLPAWLKFYQANTTFIGHPGASDLGSYLLMVTATDSKNKSSSLPFTLDVTTGDIFSWENAAKTLGSIAGVLFTMASAALVYMFQQKKKRYKKASALLYEGRQEEAEKKRKARCCNCLAGVSKKSFDKLKKRIEKEELEAVRLVLRGKETTIAISTYTHIPAKRLDAWEDAWKAYKGNKKITDGEALRYFKQKEKVTHHPLKIAPLLPVNHARPKDKAFKQSSLQLDRVDE